MRYGSRGMPMHRRRLRSSCRRRLSKAPSVRSICPAMKPSSDRRCAFPDGRLILLGSHGSRFVWMICASTRSSALRGPMSRRSRRIFRRAIVPASNSPEISPRTLPRPAWTGGFSQSLPLRKTVARACSDERALSNRPRLRVGAMSHGARRLRFTCCRRFRASGSAARSSSTRNIYLMFRAR